MSIGKFLDVVPKGVKIAACLIGGAVAIAALAGAFFKGHGQNAPFSSVLPSGGFGLLVGVLAATWILGLGYVYADARRRAMPPIPWTLIAVLVPNLLGFLLYFALRRPIAQPCPQCGQPITADQRFCSACGTGAAALSSPAS
jgi:hypothetical protein